MYEVEIYDDLDPKTFKSFKSMIKYVNEQVQRMKLPGVDEEFIKTRMKLNTRMKLRNLPAWLLIKRLK